LHILRYENLLLIQKYIHTGNVRPFSIFKARSETCGTVLGVQDRVQELGPKLLMGLVQAVQELGRVAAF
jgi:hypothetical protein